MDKDSNINLNINNVNSSETNDTKTADIISTEHIDNTAVSENAQEKLKAELNKRLQKRA